MTNNNHFSGKIRTKYNIGGPITLHGEIRFKNEDFEAIVYCFDNNLDKLQKKIGNSIELIVNKQLYSNKRRYIKICNNEFNLN